MCGSSATQQQLSTEEAAAYTTAQQMTATQYANQQAIYGPLTAQFQSIFNKGPSQEGFSPTEVQDLNAQAVEGTAQNYQQAARAVGEQEAAEGGGTNPLPTGAQEQLKDQIATSAAGNESNEETQIKAADFAQGHSDFENAAGGLESIATGENPLGYEAAEGNAGSVANTEANQVNKDSNSWMNAIFGSAGDLAGDIPWGQVAGSLSGGSGSGSGSTGGDGGYGDLTAGGFGE